MPECLALWCGRTLTPTRSPKDAFINNSVGCKTARFPGPNPAAGSSRPTCADRKRRPTAWVFSCPSPMPAHFDMPAARFGLDHEWDGWLRAVERSARAVSGPDGALGQSGLTPEPPEEVHYILRPQSGRLKLDLTVVRRLKAGGSRQT